MKKSPLLLVASCFVSIIVCSNASAQNLVIYPSNGQSKEQQSTDEGECFIWARDNSDYDPLNVSAPELVSAPTQTTQRRGEVLRSAAKGAIIGGIVDGSDGAKDGAAIGGVLGLGRQGRRNQQAQVQQQQQTVAANQQNTEAIEQAEAERANYNRYYATCLEGRGYAVN